MKVQELQKEILRLKKEKDVCVLAHAYQSQPILEIADYIGDSYGLSVQAAKHTSRNLVMAGVRFMAETCKILCPNKNVYLPNPVAGCPMADQMKLKTLEGLKLKYPDYAVVAYINTAAELKTACDVCVTSSSAVKICRNLDSNKILFIPDPNLGQYVAAQLPEKQFVFYNGGCPHHMRATKQDVERAKQAHPGAFLLAHPECRAEVTVSADYVGSTTGIMDFVEHSDAEEFIIGTENSIVEHLQYDYPNKKFYPLSPGLSCADMRITTLMDIYHCIKGNGGEKIVLSDEVMTHARRCIQRMIELGG